MMQPEGTTRERGEGRRAYPAVRVRLLGGFGASVDRRGVPREAWSLRKAVSLVKLLSLAPSHALHREQITEALWPDLGRRAASNNLRQALHAARRALHPAPEVAARLLASSEERIVLCPEGELWVDAEAFEEAARSARRAKEPLTYEAAIDIYRGELLPEDRYEEWAEEPRARLRGTHLLLLLELASLHEMRSDFGSAEGALGKLLAEEPTNEDAHASLMRIYALCSRRGEALAQYGRLEGILSRKLAVVPSASVRALREEIASGRYPSRDTSRGAQPAEEEIPRHNIPASRTSFVGRERELLEAKRLLASTRLLTLTGAGGTGKTRLALELTRDLAAAFPDGAWLVELAPLAKEELVAREVARILKVREQPGEPIERTLARDLRDKGSLLVLDNCEHLLGACARLTELLLGSCPNLKVLATSREQLGLAGEVVWHVPPLAVPQEYSAADEVGEYAAVRLFVERARLKIPAFSLTAGNAGSVSEVCRWLEGVPLAVELAAARMGTMVAEQLAERLDDTLGLLASGPSTAAPRQRTMRATIEWSHGLLPAKERTAFHRLSVFAGGFTLEAAEAVLAGDGIARSEILDLVSTLVDKSLLIAEISSGYAPRYRMLEPVRQYAGEKLEGNGEAETVMRRHGGFFLALAEEAESGLLGERREEWVRRQEWEQANFRTALDWAFSQGNAELGLRLAAALFEFWNTRGFLSEGRGWLEMGLSSSGDASARTRAKALGGAGWIAMSQGDYEGGRACIEESVGLYRQLGDKQGLASAIANLGNVAIFWQQGQESVSELRQESARLRSEIEDRRTIANLLLFEAMAENQQLFGPKKSETHAESVAARSRALRERALALSREAGNTRDVGHCLIDMGFTELMIGNHERAKESLRELLRLSLREDDKVHAQFALFGLAGAAASRGMPARAARLWAAAEGAREAFDIQLPPLARATTGYEWRLAAVRSELGEEALERAWSEGRAMAPEEAVRYALSEEEPAPQSGSEAPLAAQVGNLTNREREITELVTQGLTNRQIASELFISERTVATHVGKIFKKLEIHSRDQVKDLLSNQGWAKDR